jgi:hypothetical protein
MKRIELQVWRMLSMGCMLLCISIGQAYSQASPVGEATGAQAAEEATSPLKRVKESHEAPAHALPAAKNHENHAHGSLVPMNVQPKAERVSAGNFPPQWSHQILPNLQPTHPNRPIPGILMATGGLIVVVSVVLAFLSYLLIGIAFPLGLLTFFLWIVFGATAVIGVLLLIGGIIAALAGNKKRKTTIAPPTDN